MTKKNLGQFLIEFNLFTFLGIQQENRHIRQLQHENKELRAALEEHQNVLELIMSKYREHMSCLVNSTKIEKDMLIRENSKVRFIYVQNFKIITYKKYQVSFFETRLETNPDREPF